jgi:hypothetical protein
MRRRAPALDSAARAVYPRGRRLSARRAAAAEVTHHFVYRISSERRQDDGKSLLVWKSRVRGNVGQQLLRMRRRG